jgi:hypothetical protein
MEVCVQFRSFAASTAAQFRRLRLAPPTHGELVLFGCASVWGFLQMRWSQIACPATSGNATRLPEVASLVAACGTLPADRVFYLKLRFPRSGPPLTESREASLSATGLRHPTMMKDLPVRSFQSP